MLYLIGGASRAGKSKLARRLLMERHLPYLSLDILMMGIVNGVPSFGHNPDAPALERGEQMWSLVRAMAVNIVETELDYVIEGDILLPHHVAAFVEEYEASVRACFVGYASIAVEQKIADIRTKGGEANDWLVGADDAYVRGVVQENLEFSVYLLDACERHDLRYFDTSQYFDVMLEAALDYLGR